MIRKIADEDPDESNDKDKKGAAVINSLVSLQIFGLFTECSREDIHISANSVGLLT